MSSYQPSGSTGEIVLDFERRYASFCFTPEEGCAVDILGPGTMPGILDLEDERA